LLTKKCIYIDDWLIDPQKRTAKHPERGLFQLKGKSVQVLMVLAEANGGVVNKSDILKQVWPDIVVTENSLTQAISELRKVFGDSRSAPKYIQTFPNQGYCLCIPKGNLSRKNKSTWRNKNVKYLAMVLITLVISICTWFYINSPNKSIISSPDGKHSAIITSNESNNFLAIFSTAHSISKELFFRQLIIRSPDTFYWSVDSQFFISAMPEVENVYQFIFSPVGSIDKFIVNVPKQLNEHSSEININSTSGGVLPFTISSHVEVTKYLHVWHLSNGQSIQIHFDKTGPTKVSWH